MSNKIIKRTLGISLLSISVALTSCAASTKYEEYLVAKPIEPKTVYRNIENKDALDCFYLLNGKLSNLLYDNGNDNTCISPISIYMALSMLENSIKNDDAKQIEDFMNIDKKANKELYQEIYKRVTGHSSLTITNSIWLDKSLNYIDEGINELTENYYAYPFSVNFKESKTCDLVHDFIYNHTDENINYTPEYDYLRLLLLINTIFVKDGWNLDGSDLSLTNDKYNFHNYDDTLTSTNLLKGEYNRGKVFKSEVYSKFYTDTSHGITLEFVVPNEGYNVDDLFKENAIYDAITSNYTYADEEADYYTEIFFPAFSAGYNQDIKSILADNGISFLDRPTRLSNLIKDDKDVLVNEFTHIAKVDVNKSGLTAAAATIIDICATASMPRPEIYDTFVVDKPCAYIIKLGSIPLFVGAIKHI